VKYFEPFGSANHERNFPGTKEFFQNLDSGGECGVPAQTIYNMPTKNKDKYWCVFHKDQWLCFTLSLFDFSMNTRSTICLTFFVLVAVLMLVLLVWSGMGRNGGCSISVLLTQKWTGGKALSNVNF
jgi:hypothetical protein